MTPPLSRPQHRLGHSGRVALASLAGLLGLTGCVLSHGPVAVNAVVEPSYIRPADTNGRPLPQSYVFVPGRRFTGLMKYSVLEKVKFTDLLPPLAEGLRQQNYLPAADPNKADLLIVVHWGVIDVLGDSVPLQQRYEDTTERFNDLVGAIQASVDAGGAPLADASSLNQTFREMGLEASKRDVDMSKVAGLLGYSLTLARASKEAFSSVEAASLNADLAESRYLVVLAAYEREPTQGGKRRRMWVTRLSLRAPGRNFEDALPALIAAGRQVFGRETDGVLRVSPGTPVPHVRLGELQVIETVSNESLKPAEDPAR